MNVDPLGYPSGPLSTPSQYEVESSTLSLCEVKSEDLSQHENRNKVLPQCEIKSKDLSLSKHKTKDLPQNEVKSENLSLSEPEYKKDSQKEIKSAEVSQGEIMLQDLSQSKMTSLSLSMSTYLPPSTEGTGGALTGHSTAAHRYLRSLPPALEPGIKEASETTCLINESPIWGAEREEDDFQTWSGQDLQASPPGVSAKL